MVVAVVLMVSLSVHSIVNHFNWLDRQIANAQRRVTIRRSAMC
jgi:hypothetical protein